MRPESIEQLLQEIKCPLTAVFGELDNLIHLDNVVRMTAVLAAAWLLAWLCVAQYAQYFVRGESVREVTEVDQSHNLFRLQIEARTLLGDGFHLLEGFEGIVTFERPEHLVAINTTANTWPLR